MTDHDLSELLDRLGERVPVGSPPTGEMLAAGARARRRRTTWLAAGTAAAVACTIGGVTLLGSGSDPSQPAPPSFANGGRDAARYRLVGIGHIAVAVPEEWGTNRELCRSPQEDTVIIDVGLWKACNRPYPKNVDSVWLGPPARSPPSRTGCPSRSTVSGPNARRRAATRGTTSRFAAAASTSRRRTCWSPPSHRRAREEVDRHPVLDPHRAGPGPRRPRRPESVTWDYQDDDAGVHYRSELRDPSAWPLGLSPMKRARVSRSYVLGVEPRSGGRARTRRDTVTMTEVAAPEDSAD